ncbi:MAG: DUF4159 domain-containing protein [Gemmatimonadota bacterium]
MRRPRVSAWASRATSAVLLASLVVGAAPPPTALVVARLQYEGGGDWYANPSSLPNLIAAVRQRTTLQVAPQELRVRIGDERLAEVGFLHLTGHGEFRLADAEVARLRTWLLRGGFLHADDNYGLDASFRREIARVFPDRPLVEVPLAHAVYRAVYPFPRGLPKIHEHDGKPPRGYGVFVGDRLAVFYSHESDLGNGWEDVGTYPDDPPEKHEAALRMGVNLVAYAATSRLVP